MTNNTAKNVKREQKKSLFFRYILRAFQQLSETEALLREVYVTRVDFSSDLGICYIYFSTHTSSNSAEIFKTALERLKLYKNSLRKSLAQEIKMRYVPDLMFLYDESHEKQLRIEELLMKVQDDLAKREDPTHEKELSSLENQVEK